MAVETTLDDIGIEVVAIAGSASTLEHLLGDLIFEVRQVGLKLDGIAMHLTFLDGPR